MARGAALEFSDAQVHTARQACGSRIGPDRSRPKEDRIIDESADAEVQRLVSFRMGMQYDAMLWKPTVGGMRTPRVTLRQTPLGLTLRNRTKGKGTRRNRERGPERRGEESAPRDEWRKAPERVRRAAAG